MEEKVIILEDLRFIIRELTESDNKLLNESKQRGRKLIGNYTYDIHQPHNPTGDYHLNLYKKGKQILSINKADGRAHDDFHGIRIPNKAFKALKDKFSDWQWPDNQILETEVYTYIVEETNRNIYRLVKIPDYKDHSLKQQNGFTGYFHQFADDPFLTGGSGGWIHRTVALVEDENGQIRKIPVEYIRFIDNL